MKICPECSFEIEEQTDVCPKCGCFLKINKPIKYINKIGFYLFIIAAVFCQIFGIYQITNNDYKYYCEHISECIKDYDIVRNAAISDESENLRNTYFIFSERYEDMIEFDKKNRQIQNIFNNFYLLRCDIYVIVSKMH